MLQPWKMDHWRNESAAAENYFSTGGMLPELPSASSWPAAPVLRLLAQASPAALNELIPERELVLRSRVLEELGRDIIKLALAWRAVTRGASPAAASSAIAQQSKMMPAILESVGTRNWLIRGKGGGNYSPDSELRAATCRFIAIAMLVDGFAATRDLVLKSASDSFVLENDPKSRLQSIAQGQGLGAPIYETLKQEGPQHAVQFTVRARVGRHSAVATGSSRRNAEKAAAEQLLKSFVAAAPPAVENRSHSGLPPLHKVNSKWVDPQRVALLERAIAYRFSQPKLAAAALMHPSYSNEHPGAPGNASLSCLGAHLIPVIAAGWFIYGWPAQSGTEILGYCRTQVANVKGLATFATLSGISRLVQLGRGLQKLGSSATASAEAVQAVLAAQFIDSGDDMRSWLEQPSGLAERLYRQMVETSSRSRTELLATQPTSHMQTFVQAVRAGCEFSYSCEGPKHSERFSCLVTLNGSEDRVLRLQGKGHSKRDARSNAAGIFSQTIAALLGRWEPTQNLLELRRPPDANHELLHWICMEICRRLEDDPSKIDLLSFLVDELQYVDSTHAAINLAVLYRKLKALDVSDRLAPAIGAAIAGVASVRGGKAATSIRRYLAETAQFAEQIQIGAGSPSGSMPPELPIVIALIGRLKHREAEPESMADIAGAMHMTAARISGNLQCEIDPDVLKLSVLCQRGMAIETCCTLLRLATSPEGDANSILRIVQTGDGLNVILRSSEARRIHSIMTRSPIPEILDAGMGAQLRELSEHECTLLVPHFIRDEEPDLATRWAWQALARQFRQSPGAVFENLGKALHDIKNLWKSMDAFQNRATEERSHVFRHLGRAEELREQILLQLRRINIELQPFTTPNFAEIDLAPLMRSVLSEIARSLRGLDLESRLPASATPVRGDPMLLRIAIQNLVVNAMESTKAGGVLRANLGEVDGRVVIEVANTGVTLDSRIQTGSSDPVLVPSIVSTKPRGSGVGLQTVQHIIKVHSGIFDIKCQSGMIIATVSLPILAPDRIPSEDVLEVSSND